LLSSAKSVAIVLPARLSAGTFGLVQELAGLLKGVLYCPLVMRGNVQGALDMGVMPDYFPGYGKVGADSAAALGSVWNAVLPETPGMNAVDMMRGITNGRLASLYIMGDDPVGSDPELAATLQRLEFLVVQDIFLTETAKLANVVLPAASFIEKSGTITTIERRLRRITEAEVPLMESKADWEIIQELARQIGAPMNYPSAAAIMKELKTIVPMYRDLAIGACWPPEQSPLRGTIADLSLSSDTIMTREVITSGRQLFSSGMMTTRSKELTSIALPVEAIATSRARNHK
jgi:anaerobic selenocysteine-containing dehydrogenase